MNSVNRRKKFGLKNKNRHLYILIAFLFFEYVRIQDSYFTFLAPFSIPMLLNIILLFLVVFRSRDLPKDGLIYLILAFWALMVVHVPFATNNFHAFNATKSMFLTLIIVLSTTILVDTEFALKKLFESIIYIVLLVSIWVVWNGGIGPGGFVRDENDVCLFLVVGLPFCWYFQMLEDVSKIKRWLARVTVIAAVIAIIATSSRGGFLGFAAVLGTALLFTRKPMRNILLSIIFSLFLGGLALNFIPENYVADMKTITDKDNSTRNLRLLHWTTAWEIYKDNPVFGVGPQNYPWNSAHYFHLSPYFQEGAAGRSGRESHSLYFTLIPELGTIGTLIYLTLILSFYRRGLSVRSTLYGGRSAGRDSNSKIKNEKTKPNNETIFWFMTSLLVGMTGFLVSAAFITVLYYPIFWNFVGFSIATWWIFIEAEKVPHAMQGRRINGGVCAAR